jgi:hypothetical protein
VGFLPFTVIGLERPFHNADISKCRFFTRSKVLIIKIAIGKSKSSLEIGHAEFIVTRNQAKTVMGFFSRGRTRICADHYVGSV